MKNSLDRVFGAGLVALFVLLLAASTTVGQDIAKVAPDKVKVLLENDKVRVCEIRYKPGDKIGMHSHPAYVIYFFEKGKIKLTTPDGNTREADVFPDLVVYRPPVTHATEWLGPGEGRELDMELKGLTSAQKKAPAGKKTPAEKKTQPY